MLFLKRRFQKTQRQKQTTTLKEEYGVDYAKEQIKDSQYEYLKKYLESLDRSYAIDLLKNNKEFEGILGTNRYNLLLNYISAE